MNFFLDSVKFSEKKVETKKEVSDFSKNDKNRIFRSSKTVGEEKVNVNKADIIELQRLPGIGKATAEKIISYRNKHGAFKRKEELLRVKGIGQKKFNRLKNFIKLKN